MQLFHLPKLGVLQIITCISATNLITDISWIGSAFKRSTYQSKRRRLLSSYKSAVNWNVISLTMPFVKWQVFLWILVFLMPIYCMECSYDNTVSPSVIKCDCNNQSHVEESKFVGCIFNITRIVKLMPIFTDRKEWSAKSRRSVEISQLSERRSRT